ncbi:uncharacterized protein EI90DRAFT_925547 [Cantharellus anzutake]|uniref:uncharacterized protein n=1 Tax=Cantharellus anzutake TaxID=1750568 RepID=UPI0019048D2A|nr:uncharacterized protein EI90DRAFT_925547 [Cantharellus anzutake]KAF8332105.1 hypothetical protein EI90DRAFT_925547 [Cantharellus anzutake]
MRKQRPRRAIGKLVEDARKARVRFSLHSLDCMQSFSSSLSRTEAPSRLRLTRNPMPTVRGEQDSEFPPTPSSSSSSRSSHQDMADINNSSLTHIARASSSTDSPAARLRALTSRVLANTSSQATPPPTDRDSESDAATVKKPPASAFFTTGPARVLSGELESDIESFVGNSLPSSRASSAKQRLRDLYIRTLAANETDSTPKPPTPRRRRSSSTSPEPSRNKVTPRPNSLSDDERDRKSNTPSSADKSSRKRQDCSLNILRARLESSDVNTDLEETPNINRTCGSTGASRGSN